MTLLIERQNEIELVRAAQEGDRAAFGELVERYEHAIFAIALRRLRDYGEAQELVQEVFVQAMQRIEQLRDAERFGAWLRTIANRMAINRLTRHKVATPTEPMLLELSCVERTTPLGSVLADERHDQVHLGLSRLGEMDRDTLVAFYLQGRSLAQMSDDFASPIGTIKRRLHVARKRLAKELAELVAV